MLYWLKYGMKYNHMPNRTDQVFTFKYITHMQINYNFIQGFLLLQETSLKKIIILIYWNFCRIAKDLF